MSSKIVAEVRLALRSLAGQPGFLVVAILTLALGVGSVSAIFSVVNGVLLKPLPYPDAERIVRINRVQPPFSGPVSRQMVADWREGTGDVFSALAAFTSATTTITGSGEAERLAAYRVTPEFWDVMGLAPLHGRWFTQEEESGGQRVAVLSHAFWLRRFAGDPAVVGTDVVLDGVAHRVVGITPEAMRYPAATELYLPTYLPASTRGRGSSYLSVIVRMAPGVDVEQAEGVLGAINARLGEQYPENHGNVSASFVPLPELLTSTVREPLLVLLAASALVLLIACANLANLLLARGSQRQRELSVRAALGAGRGTLLRVVLLEALVIAMLGGALGVLVAAVAIPVLLSGAPELMPSHASPGVDARVVLSSLALAVGTVLLFALPPAFRAARVAPAAALQEEGRGGGGGRTRQRARGLLVAFEVALSLMLLVGAGLLIESLRRIGEVDVGVDPARVLTAGVVLPVPPERPGEEIESAWLRQGQHSTARIRPMVERIRAIPGVEQVAVTDSVPMGGGSDTNSSVELIGQEAPSGAQAPWAMWRFADAEYFSVLGIPVQRGRVFEPADERPGEWPTSVVVNESFVRRYLGDGDPIGRQLGNVGGGPPKTIVGVVADTLLFGRENEAPPEIYMPLSSAVSNRFQVAVKVAGDPAAYVETLRRVLREFDPNMPVLQVRSMDAVLAGGTELRRFNLQLMLVFGAVALGLAALGIYAVIAYSVAQRRHEFGIRMSLGADSGRILALVLAQGMRLASLGLLLGIGGAVVLGRMLSSQLFGVGSGDPWVIGIVTALLAAVALAACAVPALRASRIAPMVALTAP